jgi:hypothetical protein
MGAFDSVSEGTLVKDSLEPVLETGVTLNAAGTTTTTLGAQTDLLRPRRCRVRIATGTVSSTGNTATLTVAIQASNDATFATGVVTVARISLTGTDAAQTSVVRYDEVYTQKRYVRASVTLGGTAPSYAGTTIRVREKNYQRQDGDSA